MSGRYTGSSNSGTTNKNKWPMLVSKTSMMSLLMIPVAIKRFKNEASPSFWSLQNSPHREVCRRNSEVPYWKAGAGTQGKTLELGVGIFSGATSEDWKTSYMSSWDEWMGFTDHIKEENLTTFPHLMKWAAKIAEVSISVIPTNEIANEQNNSQQSWRGKHRHLRTSNSQMLPADEATLCLFPMLMFVFPLKQ